MPFAMWYLILKRMILQVKDPTSICRRDSLLYRKLLISKYFSQSFVPRQWCGFRLKMSCSLWDFDWILQCGECIASSYHHSSSSSDSGASNDLEEVWRCLFGLDSVLGRWKNSESTLWDLLWKDSEKKNPEKKKKKKKKKRKKKKKKKKKKKT